MGATRSEYPMLPALAPAPAENPAVRALMANQAALIPGGQPRLTSRAAWSWSGGRPAPLPPPQDAQQALLVK
ncbi:MAG: hypothetical protein ACLT5P_10730 [Flavonifractor plautii]